MVESRRCPAHYGILVSHAFDPKKHDKRDFHKDEHTGRGVARNQVEWFAKKVIDIAHELAIHSSDVGFLGCGNQRWIPHYSEAASAII